MLRQIWRQLVQFFRRLFRISTPPQPSPDQGEGANLTASLTKERYTRVKTNFLSDTEYEQLFIQLLDGVHQGWSRGRVEGFLIAKNLTQADLVAWLQRFGEKLLESPQPNDELAQRMVLLSQVGCGELGELSGEIGRHLLSKSGKPALTNSRDNADIDEAEAWFNQGDQRAIAGKVEEAITSFDKAVQINPDFHDDWNKRGVALANLGQFEEAI